MDIYLTKSHPGDDILKQLRTNIAEGKKMGVTLIGNRLTIRLNDPHDKSLAEVHCVILEVNSQHLDGDK